MEKQAMKQHIDETVEALRPELLEISQYIFQHPEVAHTEHKACAKQAENYAEPCRGGYRFCGYL